VVDIAGISGKLLLSPAPGLASRTSRLVRFGLRHGEGALKQPPSWLGVAPKGAAALIRLDGGWAWKGPGHPVDNGGQARCQRDGLRSEGAARVLFLLALSACSSQAEQSPYGAVTGLAGAPIWRPVRCLLDKQRDVADQESPCRGVRAEISWPAPSVTRIVLTSTACSPRRSDRQGS
jgi:hypothetical protein